MVLALQVFEGNAVKGNAADFEPEFIEADEDDLPIEEEISGDGSGSSLEEIEEEEIPLESSSGK